MNQQIYSMEQVEENALDSSRQYDYLLFAPNIEKRSKEIFVKLKNKEIFKKLIIMNYANFHKEIDKEQETSFYDEFENVLAIYVKADNDTEAIRRLCKIGIKSDDNIAIDITGFSIPNIYRVRAVLKNVFHIRNLDIFYTEPKFYIYEEGYFDAYHKNVKERNCAPVPGYYNAGTDEREILTIFLGFDGGLADLVYFKLGEEGKEIVRTLAVNGFPSYTAKLKDVSLFNNEDLINKIERGNVLCAAANNPFETYNLLCTVLKECEGTLLNLCTIGSKPMALGTCLFALDYQDKVKVTYPFYEKTHFDTDEEPGKIWRYRVKF